MKILFDWKNLIYGQLKIFTMLELSAAIILFSLREVVRLWVSGNKNVPERLQAILNKVICAFSAKFQITVMRQDHIDCPYQASPSAVGKLDLGQLFWGLNLVQILRAISLIENFEVLRPRAPACDRITIITELYNINSVLLSV
jgi:hypothetical protein